MVVKLTRDVLESYLQCKYKGYLKLTKQYGTKSDYERLLTKRRSQVPGAAIEKLLEHYTEEQIARDLPLTAPALRQGRLFVLDATFEDDLVSLHFDGLKRVDGPSTLGDFHYLPILSEIGLRTPGVNRGESPQPKGCRFSCRGFDTRWACRSSSVPTAHTTISTMLFGSPRIVKRSSRENSSSIWKKGDATSRRVTRTSKLRRAVSRSIICTW